jgi:eukaryotic-like serine/threonine-protein kinase
MTRLTFQSTNFLGVWTPDGKRVTFSALRGGPPNIFSTPADGSGSEERLTTSDNPQFPADWSPDGRVLLYTEISATGPDVWMLSLDGDRKPAPFLKTKFAELAPAFSPDGQWVAYQSNEAGRYHVFVQPFPGPGGKWMISTDGGTMPVWRGSEIIYRHGEKTMAVTVSTKPAFSAGKPRLLFETSAVPTGQPVLAYDVSPDGKQFVFVKGMRESGPTRLALVLNWTEELKKKVPGKN